MKFRDSRSMVLAGSLLLAGLASAGPVSAQAQDTTPPTIPMGAFTYYNTFARIDNEIMEWNESYDAGGIRGYLIHVDGRFDRFVPNPRSVDERLAVRVGAGGRYELRAQDNAGNLSAPVTMGLESSFGQGVSLQATAAATRVDLTWNLGGGASPGGFDILRDGVVLSHVNASTRAYTDTTLSRGVRHYAVRGTTDESGTAQPTAASRYVYVGPADGAAPSAPGSVGATVSGSSIAVTWSGATDDVGVVGYRVYSFFRRDEVGPNARSFTIPGAPPGIHRVRVGAVDPAGNVTYSGFVTVTVGGPDTTPPSPPAVTESFAFTTAPFLLLGPATDANGINGYLIHVDGVYRMFRRPLALVPIDDPWGAGLRPVLAASELYTMTGSSGWHRVDVRAQDMFQNNSVPTTLWLLDGCLCVESLPYPIGVDVVPTAAGGVTVTWDAPPSSLSELKGWVIHRDDRYVAFVPAGSSPTWSSELESPGSHSYTVRTQLRDGRYSDPSGDTVTIAEPPGAPRPPTQVNLDSSPTPPGTALVNWSYDQFGSLAAGALVHVDGQFRAWVPVGSGLYGCGCIITLDLAPGPHLVEVRTQDSRGNNSTPVGLSVTMPPLT